MFKKLLFACFMLAGLMATGACSSDDDSCEEQCNECAGALGALLDCDDLCSAARDEVADKGCDAEYEALDACLSAESDICAMDICPDQQAAYDTCIGAS